MKDSFSIINWPSQTTIYGTTSADGIDIGSRKTLTHQSQFYTMHLATTILKLISLTHLHTHHTLLACTLERFHARFAF